MKRKLISILLVLVLCLTMAVTVSAASGIDFIVEMLNDILFENQRTTVLLETMAGKGSEVGGRFEELRAIIDRVRYPQKLGVCFDTCHVWDAGYDLVADPDGVLTEFDRVVGLDRLRAETYIKVY